ncbi:MAG TPA: hypothetical protein P5032_16070 [Candidatus Competibacter sp.]|nr:hypothetical protein [Candidatus Competibacteraceae bacterium]HRW67230.1 hypothetical protein [Candidatus Competibacter sp.]
MANSPFEPWPLNEQTAKILGLPLVAVTSTAQLPACGDGWLWFEPIEQIAVWYRFTGQHAFPAASLTEALQCVEQGAIG